MGEHDNIFKRAFSVPANAAGELRSILPGALCSRLDLASLALEPASFVDEEMAQRHVDLLFSATIEGRRSFVYFLFEHQSSPDPLMPWRVLTYQQRIWAAWLRDDPARRMLPPIVTIVVHHGEHGWTAPRRFHELVDGLDEVPELWSFVPNFDFLIDDLAMVDDGALQRRPLAPFPKIALWLLRDGKSLDEFLTHLVAWAAELERLVRDGGAGDDYVTVVRYIWRVVGDGPAQIVRQRILDLAPTFGGAMPSYDERLIETGIQQGIQQGRREGIRHALRAVVRARFGEIADTVEARIAAASAEELQRWLERVVGAERIEDVFAE